MHKSVISGCIFSIAALLSTGLEASTERLQRTGIDYERALKQIPFTGVSSGTIRASANYSATTVGGPTFTRQVGNCTGPSGVGVGVNYHVQEFHVGTTGAHDVTSVQDGGWDGYIFVYQNAFDPANSSTNCVAGNDDGAGGIGTSDILGVALDSSVTYFAVTTGFDPVESGTFTNTISGPGTITIGPAGPQADLGIVKTAPDGVVNGANYTYVLTANNAGPLDATAVVVTDVLPAGVNFVSSTCGATNVAGTLTWNIGALANGANQACTLTVALAGAVCIAVSNTATIVGAEGDPVAGNNSSTTANSVAGGNVILDPSFEDGTPNGFWSEASTNFGTPICDVAGCGVGTGTGPRTGDFWAWFGGIAAAEVGSLEQSVVIPTGSTAITFYREYPICANATDFVRLLIDGVEVWREDGTSPRCNIVGYEQVSVPLTAGQANGASHLVTFDSTISGAPSGSNFFIDDVELVSPPTPPVCTTPPGADVGVTLTNTPNPVNAGAQITYIAVATNNGGAAATDMSVSLPLPTGVSLVSATASGTGTCVGTVCTWTGTTANGASETATIVGLVASNTAAGTVLSATATVDAVENDPTAANDTATAMATTAVLADVTVTLTDSPDPVTAGENITYVATVSNSGPSDAQGVTVALPAPTGTTLVSGTGVIGTVAAGSTGQATFVYAVSASVLTGTVITATATASTSTPESNAANNTGSTTTTVITSADLRLISLVPSATNTNVNVPVTFTAVSQNFGPSDAQNVVVSIVLSPDFRYTSHTATGATCTTPQVGNSGTITCTWAGATAVNATRTLVVTAFSNNNALNTVSASTSSPTPDPIANNNSQAVTVTVGLVIQGIPSLDRNAMLLLGLLLAFAGLIAIRRQN